MRKIEEILVATNLAKPKDRRQWRQRQGGGIELTRRGFLLGFGTAGAAIALGGAEILRYSSSTQGEEGNILQRWVAEFDSNSAVGGKKIITEKEWGVLDVSPVVFGKSSPQEAVTAQYILQPFPATPTGPITLPVTKTTGRMYGVHLHSYPLETAPQSNQLLLVPEGTAIDPRLQNLTGGKILNPKELDVTVGALLEVDVNDSVVYRGNYFQLPTFFIANRILL